MGLHYVGEKKKKESLNTELLKLLTFFLEPYLSDPGRFFLRADTAVVRVKQAPGCIACLFKVLVSNHLSPGLNMLKDFRVLIS